MFAALIISIVWVVVQLRQWYLPYFFDVGATEWYSEHGYDETVKILPEIGGNAVTPYPSIDGSGNGSKGVVT